MLPERLTAFQRRFNLPVLADVLDPHFSGCVCRHLPVPVWVQTEALFTGVEGDTLAMSFTHVLAHLLPAVGSSWLRFKEMSVPDWMAESSTVFHDSGTGKQGALLLLAIEPGTDYTELGRRIGVIADAALAILFGDHHGVQVDQWWWDLAINHPEVNPTALNGARYTFAPIGGTGG